MITRGIERNIQPSVPTHKIYLMFFQCLHHIPNFFGPREVCWRQERYPSGIAEPKSKTKKRIAEEIV